MEEGEEKEAFFALPVEDVLLRWFNHHLRCASRVYASISVKLKILLHTVNTLLLSTHSEYRLCDVFECWTR